MNGLLEGMTAVVTGAASGIGRAIALTYADHGANVVVADVQTGPREGGTPTHEQIRSEYGRESRFIECDVTSVAEFERAITAAEELGGIDVLVNNAGVMLDESFADFAESEYERIMAVNAKGAFFGSQIASRQMRAAGNGGSIINISSVAGLQGTRSVVYSMSKGAIRLLTYALAGELGPDGIRVNAIHPGIIETELMKEDVPIVGHETEEHLVDDVPLGRIGQPEDVADAAVYLASDLASYVTGESLIVDGGLYNTE